MPFRWMPAEGNLLTLCGEAALTVGPSFDTLTPAAQISDGRPATPVRFGSKAAEVSVGCQLNLLRNPGFELADLADWVLLSGTSVRDPSDPFNGVAALKFTSSNSVRYQDVRIPAGIPFRVGAALHGGSEDQAAAVVLLNLDTGHFLDDTGAWVANATVRTLEVTAGGYTEAGLDAVMETFDQSGRYLQRLRIHVAGDASGTFVDDVFIRPSWNFVGIFGHNFTSRGENSMTGPFSWYGQVPRYEYSTEDAVHFGWLVPGGAEDLGGQSYRIPSPNTWKVFGGISSPYITVAILSDQYAHYPAPAFGELVVGYVEDLVPAVFPIGVKLEEAGQIRNETAAGDVYVYNSGPHPLRELGLRFLFDTQAQEETLRERFYMISRAGADGVVIVPPPELVLPVGCIFGLPVGEFSESIETPIGGPGGPALGRTASLTIRELPSPEMVDPG
jgi:hypothetical protein